MKGRVLGIDVGVKHFHYVVTAERKVVERGEFRGSESLESLNTLEYIGFAGVDAPLSFPEEGTLRESEKKLYKLGIRLFPSGAEFFKQVVLKGREIARKLEEKSIKVFEVYPYATRKILGIAPDSKKNLRAGLEAIKVELREYLEFDELENADLVDAAIAALTVELYLEGKGEFVSGKDGDILIPKV